jgi:hypothetical protein
MSAGFIPYSVDVEWLEKNLRQPNNDKLHKELTTSRFFKERMRRLAVDFDLEFEDVAKALREVTHPVAKGREKAHDGALHFYLVQAIVKREGELLDNSKLYPFGIDFANAFDKALTAARVPKKGFRFDRFMTHSLPLRLPTPDDFPLVGYMRGSEITAASAGLDDVKLRDPQQNEILDEVRDWLWAAEARSHGLVVFYH